MGAQDKSEMALFRMTTDRENACRYQVPVTARTVALYNAWLFLEVQYPRD